jgi:hypothetical protein
LGGGRGEGQDEEKIDHAAAQAARSATMENAEKSGGRSRDDRCSLLAALSHWR